MLVFPLCEHYYLLNNSDAVALDYASIAKLCDVVINNVRSTDRLSFTYT